MYHMRLEPKARVIALGKGKLMSLVLRPFEEHDIDALVSFIEHARPREAMTAEQINSQMRFAASLKTVKRVLVCNAATLVGSMGFGYPIADPGEPWFFKIVAAPNDRYSEIASLLFKHLLGTMQTFDACEARSQVREDDLFDVHFLEENSFVEYARQWESCLDLRSCDTDLLAANVALPAEIEFTTLAAHGVEDGILRAIYDLFLPLLADVPSPEPPPMPNFAKFCETFLDPKLRRPELFHLALKDGAPVGLLVHRENGTDGTGLQIDFLGVHRDYRKYRIALTLKILGMRTAKLLGYRSIRTWNDTANQPVLALNEKLGFARQPAWIHYSRRTTVAP